MMHPGSPPAGMYLPILRPRRGEVTALHHLDSRAAGQVLPIFEWEPGVDLTGLIRQRPPRTPAIGVDFGTVDDPADALRSPPLELAERLVDLGVALVPVIRSYESRRRLAEHGLAARMHAERAVLRLQPHADALNPAQASAVAERVLRGTGLTPECVDLVIDLAETACVAHADQVEERAKRVLRWARGMPWRSVSVAAGAMPPNLDDLPTDRPIPVGRWDARIWARLGAGEIGYADYGVTSPVHRLGVQHHRQLPTLRYTADRDWWIYRWARRGGRSDDRCYDLCRTLVTSAQWPAEGARYSWGDAEIARRARSARGAGSSSSWIAWSTSHHIAHVLRSIAPRRPA
ncbi:beta family protein [Jidongwangia harbinensis]|uniref:beta family protein n=1 Tax=Jidongwangia harbinensis TaxID=2878561 RepID=UPI001CDA533F|nr:beta family protein [Jidongwangia harbinensis]MCA2215375.1 beta family protein [Jidongwangia harbinensis]